MALRNAPVVRSLGSVKLTLALLLILAVVTAAATLIEAANGTAYAQATVYRTRWFEALLILLGLNMIVMLVVRWPFPRTQIGFLITHISVIVILIGAGITRFFGYEGVMTIREGSSSDFLYSREDHIVLRDQGTAASAPILLYKPGAQRIERELSLNGELFQASLVEYWPHAAERFEEGSDGAPLLELAETDPRHAHPTFLEEGDTDDHGGVPIRFLGRSPLPAPTVSQGSTDEAIADSPSSGNEEGRVAGEFGTLHIDQAGRHETLAIAAHLPVSVELPGGRVEVIERNPDFRVGQPVDLSAPMRNPSILVRIHPEGGRPLQRRLFALHPTFTVGDSLTGAVAEMALRYTWTPSVDLALAAGGGLTGRSSVALTLVSATGERRSVPAGTEFALTTGESFQIGAAGYRIANVWTSAVRTWGPSESENDPPVARVAVRNARGETAGAFVPVRNGSASVELGGEKFAVEVGPVRIPVDYSIHLDDFVLVTYPGSSNPASFESHVRLYDPARGIDGRPVRIYMNHPLTYRGFKHFQSSYDSDRKGTVLSVNNDPGKWPTYVGYTLMTIGFLITLTRGLLWNRHPAAARAAASGAASRTSSASAGTAGIATTSAAAAADKPRRRNARTTTTIGLGFLCLLLPWSPGRDSTRVTIALGPSEAQAQDLSATAPRPFLSGETRDELRTLVVQDYQGRMKPLDTFAREMVVKVTKRTNYAGWDPVELYINWVAHPREWFQEPLVSVRNPGLKQLLGIAEDISHVSLASLFDGKGGYRLADEVELAHRTPDRDRTTVQRKLLAFDDQVNLLLLTLQGQTLRVLPLPNDPNHRWMGGDIFESLPPEHEAAFRARYDLLIHGLQHEDETSIARAVPAIQELQTEHGSAVLPGDRKIQAELWLNSINPFVRVMIPYGLVLGILGFAYIWGLAKRANPKYSLRDRVYALGLVVYIAAMGFHLFGYLLRWTASSHAPMSNGYESLIFISLIIALAGFYYEMRDRRGSTAALSSLLVLVVLGVAMLPTFDPAISPIVPVLASYWLIIHVGVITASYAFLGLGACMGMALLILHLFKGPGRDRVRRAILEMTGLLWRVLVAGLAFLSVGTLLGGVWANESWGRYWGWDPKETWALVTILVYAAVVHLRYIPPLSRPWVLSAASFLAISSVIMTYLGVNYLLSGLHSYGGGEATGMPTWAYVTGALMVLLVGVSYWADRTRDWQGTEGKGVRESTYPAKRNARWTSA